MEEHCLSTGQIPDDYWIYLDIMAYVKAEKAGFPKPVNLEIGTMWWEKGGRHFIDTYNVERYIPF